VPKGAYILADCSGAPDLLLLATGSEVHLALAAQPLLAGHGVKTRVVAMPSWELFRLQPQAYRNHVLPSAVTARLSIEAGASLGWHEWVGSDGDVLGLNHFGASAPGPVVLEKFGFSVENVVKRALALKGVKA
jgi:transketolase